MLKLLTCIALIGFTTAFAKDSPFKWEMDDVEGSQLEDQLTDDEYAEGQQPTCAACISAVGILEALVRSNATYEEMRNASISVCYVLVPGEGWDPDTLCSLAIDTYAPHVIYILNVTDKTPREICTLYNNCPSASSSSPPGVVRRGYQVAPPGVADGRSSSQTVSRRRRTPAEWKALNYTGALRLVHVTDIHTDYMYAEGSPTQCAMPLCCRTEYNGTGSARYWGDYPCNIPHRTVDLMFSDIARRFRPQIVACTGDTVQHTVWDQPLDQTIEVDRYITERLSHWFPDSASYISLGNHDACPTNLFYANRPENQILTEAMFNHWQPLAGFGSEQQATFTRGAYYSILYRAGLRIVSYNSNYGSLENFYSILNVDEPDYYNMKQFLEDTLASARQNGEKVILLGHHPTGSNGYLLDYGRFITDVHARFSDVIMLHLLGHGHSDTFALVRDFETGEARGVQLSSPSMTSYTDINPSYRVIYLDPDTFEPLDSDTYHLDLNADADNPTPEVKFVYRMSDEYGMPDMSAASFNDFVNRMEIDRGLMDLYRYNAETRVYRPDPCDDDCAAGQLCNLRNTDSERKQECFDSIVPPRSHP